MDTDPATTADADVVTRALVARAREGDAAAFGRLVGLTEPRLRLYLRVRMGPLRLGELPSGKSRPLHPRERDQLLRFVRDTQGGRTRGAIGGRERGRRSRSAPRGAPRRKASRAKPGAQ